MADTQTQQTKQTKQAAGARTVSPAKTLSVFSLAMISVGAVLSVRNYPSMAVYGWSSIGWYVLGTLLFLIPLTLSSAELATGWSSGGGVYEWVKVAFGEKAGFIAVFCEWSNNIVWFPTVLSFIAGTLAYAINPKLADNGWFMFVTMMAVFWLSTLTAWLGPKITARINNLGVVLGSLVPSALLIAFGVAYVVAGKHSALPAFSLPAALPSLKPSTLPFVATVVLLFAGMEMSGFHALEVKDPKRDFPVGMGIAALVVFAASVLCTLAMGLVIPAKDLKLASGIMEAFQTFLKAFSLSGLVPFCAVLIALGGFALLTTWLVGPILGLGVTARAGDMPPVSRRVNKHGIPVNMLVFQGIIATVVSFAYVVFPSVNQAYWVLSAITVMLMCITYMLVFAAVIRLRIKRPDVPRAFKIPGGLPGVWIVGGLGFVATAFTFIVGILPPSGMELFKLGSGFHAEVATFLSSAVSKKVAEVVAADMVKFIPAVAYSAIILIGTAILALPPLVFLRLKKPSWVSKDPD
ncbi:MAG: APC family permease [Actinomycetes bacterium]|nr:APC family permease [Actinomycetes bacterium]